MAKPKNPDSPTTATSAFEEFWAKLRSQGGTVSADALRDMLGDLIERQRHAEKEKRAPARRKAAERREPSAEEKAAAEAEAERERAHVAEVTSMELPLDWENAFLDDPRTEGVHAESIPDALILSLTTLGRVDIEYIASVTGAELRDVIGALHGSIYQNPETWDECFYQGWETAEEYLSGDLLRKLRVAKEANTKYHGYFKNNVDALKKLLPSPAAPGEIYITLGSPWVPTDVIDAFATHLLSPMRGKYTGTLHDERSGSWELPKKSEYYYRNFTASTHTWGTRRMEALVILEKTLNMKTATVYDEKKDYVDGKTRTRRILNKQESTFALEKQRAMIAEFQSWVHLDKARSDRLYAVFTERYGYIRRRIFDGSFLDFPTMARGITLYPYQKNAVARILFSPNTLLAHDVGSGKTYIMIAAGMELRRMGLSKKNLYVVPNSVLGQWRAIFAMLYPDAKILCVTPSSFTPQKRGAMLERIRDEDTDAILMPYSSFEQIPISRECREEMLTETAEELARIAKDPAKSTAKVARQREAVVKKLTALMTATAVAESLVPFEELGITRLFVDEAHNYKNIEIDTQSDHVLGISAGGAKKCRDMMDKVHIVQRMNGGGGVVMATGTPITNSITDIYAMQKYLQSGSLALLDLSSFDSWIGMFAERTTDFEIDVDTSSYRMATRFAKFHNLPELTALLSGIADFHSMDPSAGIPALDGYTDVLIPRSPTLEQYLKTISRRADDVRAGRKRAKEDNMLKITTDGRKAALDLRLVMERVPKSVLCKAACCAERAFEVWRETAPLRSAQLIFCDTSTPKAGFNIYDVVKQELILRGVPEEEIAYIHEADSEARLKALLEATRRGIVRILIGSTPKLGLGVNVQDKLIALHHLDVPWRPADMTQREGRILRQGNENPVVKIFRYITEGSFDAYSWQLLETKQRFITSLLSGSMVERSGDEVEGTVLNYAEVKALAIGNPLVKERVSVANELTRLLLLERRATELQLRLRQEATELPGRIRHQKELLDAAKQDAAFVGESPAEELTAEEKRDLRERIALALRENVFAHEERELLTYRGFTLILPANMSPQAPFLWLTRAGRYQVEMGVGELGTLGRLDRYIDGLGDRVKRLRETLTALRSRKAGVEAELLKENDYRERITALEDKLREIDKTLGVETDE